MNEIFMVILLLIGFAIVCLGVPGAIYFMGKSLEKDKIKNLANA